MAKKPYTDPAAIEMAIRLQNHLPAEHRGPGDPASIDATLTLRDDLVMLSLGDQRFIAIEFGASQNGEPAVFVRAYSEVCDAPLNLQIREGAEIVVDRHDYDLERTAACGMDLDG